MLNFKEKDQSDLPLENGKLRILVVDDDENIREILKDTLTMAGHHSVLASSGEEALKLFYEQEFDLVLTDLGMPGISGWELNKRIKQVHPEIPVVIISGWGAQLNEEEIKTSQVNLVLPKPFTLDQILELTSMFGNKTPFNPEALKVPI